MDLGNEKKTAILAERLTISSQKLTVEASAMMKELELAPKSNIRSKPPIENFSPRITRSKKINENINLLITLIF